MENYGFRLIEERKMREVGGNARLWRHKATGAELLSIINEDENKCFGVSFFTPPTDSTGVAHILEHSVLCGSDKYPLKEPFVELLKGSLQTFLNAFTFPDKTCYPVASANLRDFYNLVDVYLDAVFHPLITKDIFYQEGWHLEAENADSPWFYKGVVYNEMKGVYSSPDSILAERSQQAVFPDNIYCLDSGGNPEKIPDLTYQAFCDFHQRYYQPGNARFFFWGDDPEDERLRLISSAISGYGPVANLPQVILQKRLPQPRYIDVPYASSEGDDRALFTTSWLLGERGDVEQAIKMEMLEHILEGLPGSPLRRALMESGLGEDTTGCGLETDLRQMYYSTGLKGIEPAAVDKGEKLILGTLKNLSENGIPADAVEAAVNSVEFALRENNSGRFPRGLAAMIQALSTWLYGGDPLGPLAWEKPLAQIKESLAKGEKIFEKAIKENFLENTHRARVTLLPDASLGRQKEDAEANRAALARDEAGPEQREEMAQETERLRKAQLAPDKPEDLAKIPALGVKDLPKNDAFIPIDVNQGHYTFITHDLPTNGIAYGTLLLPVPRLPEKLLPYLPLFTRSLVEWGTARQDYSQLGMSIAAKTGGLAAAPLAGLKFGSREPFLYISVVGKAVYEKIPDLFALMREILLEPQTSQPLKLQRLAQMTMEDKARMEYSLQAAGHGAVSCRVRSHYSGVGAINEELGGIAQLWFLREFAARLENEPEAALSDFEELRRIIVSSSGAVFDCVAEGSAFASVEKEASALLDTLPAQPKQTDGELIAEYKPFSYLPAGEAFITPGLVNYVGKGANLYDLGYSWNGSANVITRWLRMGRLWEEVRVAGGAYGVFCGLDRISGTFVCSSYRDPNVDATLSAYDGLGAYLREFNPTGGQLSQAIVGAIGDVDAWLLPDAKGAKALGRWLAGLDKETLQKNRDEILGTTARDFKDFAGVLDAAAQEGAICVLGGQKTAQAAQRHGWKEHKLI